MTDILLILMGGAIVYLGIRLLTKIREIASWSDSERIVAGDAQPEMPEELKSLQLDEMQPGELHMPDEDTGEKKDDSFPGDGGKSKDPSADEKG